MIVVEIFRLKDGIRVWDQPDRVEYSSLEAWEKDLFILKLNGTHAGHQRYDDISMAQFDALSPIEQASLWAKCPNVFWEGENT